MRFLVSRLEDFPTVSDAHLSPPQMATDESVHDRKFFSLSLAALGVVFGDISTSPLYAIRECFHGDYGIPVNDANVLGVLSLMFWALLLIVTFKYLTFILRADNQGEGGVIALTALVRPKGTRTHSIRWGLVAIGLFGACLLYGDGMITPAISVLSAVEGIEIVTPVFVPYVIPITILILGALFFVQYRGTARVGRLFGPFILIWLSVLALLGLVHVAGNPRVLTAMWPAYAFRFLLANKGHGFIVLGAVFLVVTGSEALYADMGHFGKRPIRLTWLTVVLPALVLNYFGQGALLLHDPSLAKHSFYAMVPHWALIPMVVLATAATIIASQAVITGSFSLTRQAIQLGYLPRLRIVHTSAAKVGQIYIAPVNWLLMVCTISLVLGFQSSSRLAAAYGVAVTSTMLITTVLFFVVIRRMWKWPLPLAAGLCGLFLVVDLAFFSANLSKILHGAWFPLVIGAVAFTIMLTWNRGRELLAQQHRTRARTFDEFTEQLEMDHAQKVKGQAVFLTSNPNTVPSALAQNVKHNHVIHSDTALLHITTEDVPRVPNTDKVTVEKLPTGLYRIIARYGFMEQPRVENILAFCREQGLEFKPEETSYFLGREKLRLAVKPGMQRWRAALFLFMSRNAMDASTFFDIPAENVIEVGVQLEV